MAFKGLKDSPKVDNNPQALRAKADIRRRVLTAIGADKAAVLDAFAGTGQMFSEVWKLAAGYTGIDERWHNDSRRMFVGDNRRVMRAIDLRPFNLFDLDAYGSPWTQAMIIADRRRVVAGEVLGLVVTEGTGLHFKNNGVPAAVIELAGVRTGMVGTSRMQDTIINRAIAGLARRMRCDLVSRWQAEGRTGSAMRYIGIVMKGT